LFPIRQYLAITAKISNELPWNTEPSCHASTLVTSWDPYWRLPWRQYGRYPATMALNIWTAWLYFVPWPTWQSPSASCPSCGTSSQSDEMIGRITMNTGQKEKKQKGVLNGIIHEWHTLRTQLRKGATTLAHFSAKYSLRAAFFLQPFGARGASKIQVLLDPIVNQRIRSTMLHNILFSFRGGDSKLHTGRRNDFKFCFASIQHDVYRLTQRWLLHQNRVGGNSSQVKISFSQFKQTFKFYVCYYDRSEHLLNTLAERLVPCFSCSRYRQEREHPSNTLAERLAPCFSCSRNSYGDCWMEHLARFSLPMWRNERPQYSK